MATLHFISGKGGVGRSTFAAALTERLTERGEGPVLLLEVQGSGRSLQLCGLNGPKPLENTALPNLRDAWGARLLPKETFRQYFSLLLSLGNEFSSFATATAGLRDRVVDVVVDNKIVSAFIDVCPGLEPAVLLGKLHWEATEGRVPDSNEKWRHVVVDGPATGHGLALFRSTDALREIFAVGPIHKQADAVMSFVRDRAQTHVYVISTPEELPVRETLDLRDGLLAMRIHPYAFVMNRCSPEFGGSADAKISDELWRKEIEFEREMLTEQNELIGLLKSKIGAGSELRLLPEIFSEDPAKIAAHLSAEIKI